MPQETGKNCRAFAGFATLSLNQAFAIFWPCSGPNPGAPSCINRSWRLFNCELHFERGRNLSYSPDVTGGLAQDAGRGIGGGG